MKDAAATDRNVVASQKSHRPLNKAKSEGPNFGQSGPADRRICLMPHSGRERDGHTALREKLHWASTSKLGLDEETISLLDEGEGKRAKGSSK